jgi:hypothetical protein
VPPRQTIGGRDWPLRWRRAAAAGMFTTLAIALSSIAGVSQPHRTLEAAPADEPTLLPTSVVLDGEALRVSVPAAWRRVDSGSKTMFAPVEGHAQLAGQPRVTYGIELGIAPVAAADFSGAFDEMVQAVTRSNPDLRIASITRLLTIAGRMGLRGTFSNTSTITRRSEFVVVAAAPIGHARALYVIGVAPSDQWSAFRPTLEMILTSIEKGR